MWKELFSNPSIIAGITFLWYRRGRLWNFYYSIIDESLKQIISDSLDRKAWEEMASQNLDKLVNNLFGILCEFEIEYLRFTIHDKKYLLWVSDSATNTDEDYEITDKEAFCIYCLRKTYFTDFRLCGLVLFVKSLFYYLFRNKKEKGYTGKIKNF